MTNRQVHDDHDPRSVLLFPLAFLHSHIYWFCSVIWTVCATLSTEPVDPPPSPPPPETPTAAVKTVTTAIKRPRGFSAPPPHSAQAMVAREHCATFSAGMSVDGATRRPRRFLQLRQQALTETEVEEMRPSLSDERAGTTCPPQWWQKTRFYIDALKHSSPNSSVVSLDALDDVRPSMDSTESAPVCLPAREARTKRFLRSFRKPSDGAAKQQSASLRRLWKKKTTNVAATTTL